MTGEVFKLVLNIVIKLLTSDNIVIQTIKQQK